MRKIILALGLVSSLSGFAQLEKNTVFVGGFVLPRFANFLQPFSIDNVYSRITPSAGIMLSNKWALGAEFNYQAHGPISNRYYESFSISGFARYYLTNEKKFAMYGNFAMGYKHIDINTFTFKQKIDLLPMKIGLGTSYFIGKNLSLDLQANLGFNAFLSKPYLDAKLGIHYYIRSKKK